MAPLEHNNYVVCPQLIIQGVPNLSTSIPQPLFDFLNFAER
jgi:hypothetical protein